MAPIALDWHDLEEGGRPAVLRALERLVVLVNYVESQQLISLNRVEERLATLEHVLSEKLMREMLPELGRQRGPVVMEMAGEMAQLREDLAELARRWGIERAEPRPAALPIEPPTGCAACRPASSRDGMVTVAGEPPVWSPCWWDSPAEGER
jgi:hypothetical protein